MGNPIRNDFVGATHGATVRTEVNAGKKLRLFRNNFTSGPANVLADFTECNLSGYAEIDIAGQWGAVANPTPGTFQSTSNTFTFTTTDLVGQTIWGWYITDGTNVLWSRNELAGFMFNSANPLAFQITLRSKAEFLT